MKNSNGTIGNRTRDLLACSDVIIQYLCFFIFLLSYYPSMLLEQFIMWHFMLKVLDEEAEVFVVKMWRLLIYEIEAKKLGLVK